MARRPDVTEGMVVRSSDGRELGTIIRCSDANFQIEKGVFFPDEYLAAYEEIGEVRGGEAYLSKGVEELRPLDPTGPEATGVVTSAQELEQWTEDGEFDEEHGKRRAG